jgi:hypothetical protein
MLNPHVKTAAEEKTAVLQVYLEIQDGFELDA